MFKLGDVIQHNRIPGLVCTVGLVKLDGGMMVWHIDDEPERAQYPAFPVPAEKLGDWHLYGQPNPVFQETSSVGGA